MTFGQLQFLWFTEHLWAPRAEPNWHGAKMDLDTFDTALIPFEHAQQGQTESDRGKQIGGLLCKVKYNVNGKQGYLRTAQVMFLHLSQWNRLLPSVSLTIVLHHRSAWYYFHEIGGTSQDPKSYSFVVAAAATLLSLLFPFCFKTQWLWHLVFCWTKCQQITTHAPLMLFCNLTVIHKDQSHTVDLFNTNLLTSI